MRLHLDRDRDEPLVWEETLAFEPAALGQDLLVELGPVAVSGRLLRIEESGDPAGAARSRGAHGGAASFHVTMDLRYRQALACTRCLRPVGNDVSTVVEILVTALPRAARDGEARGGGGHGAEARRDRAPARHGREAETEAELAEDDLGALLIEGEHLDTEAVVAEQILLEVPMKPLCDPGCRGLCPRCGADRNLVAECCPEPAGDERWEALEALREKLAAQGR